MSIATYDDLKSAIESWAARDGDTTISGRAADYVTLGEARLNRLLSTVRVNLLNTTLTGTTSSRSLALPTGFIEPIALFLTTSGDHIQLKPLVAGTFEYGTTSGTPSGWCINGENIDLDVPCDQAHTFSFRYRGSFALSDDEDENWLLTNHSDAYLSACMVEYFMFSQKEERAAVWQQRLNLAIEEITAQEARSQSVATLSVDPALAARQQPFNYTTGL